jgi:adenylylsulfate kinase-like enzyme
VHLDCPVEVCAARDRKGHYKRAFASEYECFIGVTHPYERSDSADLRLDTSALSPARAEAILAERVIAFLSESDQGSHFSPLQERLG